jgi:hypothetical protein
MSRFRALLGAPVRSSPIRTTFVEFIGFVKKQMQRIHVTFFQDPRTVITAALLQKKEVLSNEPHDTSIPAAYRAESRTTEGSETVLFDVGRRSS